MPQTVEFVAESSVEAVEDVDWPLMGVKAPQPIDGEIEYGGEEQVVTAVTVVEVDEAPIEVEVGGAVGAAADEEGEVAEVEDAIDMTSPAGGPLSPTSCDEGWGSVPRYPPAAVLPTTPEAMHAAAAT